MIGCPLAWKFNCTKPFFLQSGKISLVPRLSHRPIFDSLHPYDGNIFTKDVDRHRNERLCKSAIQIFGYGYGRTSHKSLESRKSSVLCRKFLVCCLYGTGKCTKKGSVAVSLCQLYEVASIHRSHVQLTWPTDNQTGPP